MPIHSPQALAAELITTRLPLLALELLCTHPDLQHDDDFEVIFLRAAAYMAAGDLLAAKKNFARAHQLRPEEIAVHRNLALILRGEGSQAAARDWLCAGLRLQRDAVQLWLELQLLDTPAQLLTVADELLAWRGGSLYVQLTGDVATALTLYRRVFTSGERDGAFLIEFTGALGHQHCNTELATLAWQLLAREPLPWQVYEHFAQGFTQLDNQQQAQRCLTLAAAARRHS